MQRRTKGGLIGVAVFTVLAVVTEIGETDGDDGAEVAATSAPSQPSETTGSAAPEPTDSASAATTTAEPEPAESEPTATEPAQSGSAQTGPQETSSDDRTMAADDSSDVWTVVHVVDGDTIDVARGDTEETVRIVGIDTPERGECGYDEATVALQELIAGVDVELTGSGTDNRDAYGRLIRYVDRGSVDAGYEQIADGMAIARYDSRDGYGRHPREDEYIAADDATGPGYACEETEPEPEAEPETEQAPATGTEPWNQPGPDLDCGDIGQRVRITGEDYHRLDADGDGWACESYG